MRIIIILLLFLCNYNSFAIETITINKGISEPTPIAINQFDVNRQNDEQLATLIIQIISNDLKNSGLFKPIPQAAFIETTLGVGYEPLFASWRQINANLLVNGDITSLSDDLMRVRFILWDTVLEQNIVAEELILSKKLYRRGAHKIADKIYESFTGDKGYFDTKIIYISSSGQSKNPNRRMAIMDYDGENHQYLTDGKYMVLTPRLSPKSDKVLYLTYPTKIPVVRLRDLRTGKDYQLGQFNGLSFAPRFSPDGESALISISQRGATHIYEIDLNTGSRVMLTSGHSINTSATYSPDGSRIVYNSDQDGTRQLYIMNRDGSGKHRISFGTGTYATPVWSPRGDNIVFTKISKAIGFGIGVMRTDGSSEHIITTGYLVESPTWAPNGRMIMFTKEFPSYTTGITRSRIYSIDITGNNERQIPTPREASDPEWSRQLD